MSSMEAKWRWVLICAIAPVSWGATYFVTRHFLPDGAPLWSAAPYIADGRLVRVMADYEIDPDSFGPHILAVYPSHRRATAKVVAFIDYISAFLAERGLN